MSNVKDILSGLKTVIEMDSKVVSVAKAVERLGAEMRELDRRLVRIETIIEITRPEGGTLRLTRE